MLHVRTACADASSELACANRNVAGGAERLEIQAVANQTYFVFADALGADEKPHMRLDPEGRCLALRGRIGKQVRCTIYADRPQACRRVEAGSELCRDYREARGLRP